MRGIRYMVFSIQGVLILSALLYILDTPYYIPLAYSQGFNIASTYEIGDNEAVDGDILISNGNKGLVRTNISYDSKIFGIIDEKPIVVFREATDSGKPMLRVGEAIVNVTDYNGEVKKGDYVTTSPVLGKGMRAGQSGYVVGIALEDAVYSNNRSTVQGRSVKSGTVRVAIKIEYAELTTPRNTLRFLNELNAALFRNVQDPEKFTLVIRYIIAGLIVVLAFGIGFYSITRSISKAIESIGRNPLAKSAILASVMLQVGATVAAAIATVIVIFIIIRI